MVVRVTFGVIIHTDQQSIDVSCTESVCSFGEFPKKVNAAIIAVAECADHI